MFNCFCCFFSEACLALFWQ